MEISHDARMSATPDGPGRHPRHSSPARPLTALLLLAALALCALAPGRAVAEGGFSPIIRQQPASVTVEEGHPASFEAVATGLPTPSEQWEISTNGGASWSIIKKATSKQYTIPSAKNSENGTKFRAHFENSSGKATSEVATLTVAEPPVVIKQPSSRTTSENSAVLFEAVASGFPTPTVQWEVSANGGISWEAIPNETATTLLLLGVQSYQNGYEYRATFTNVAASVTSATATLTVQTAPVVTEQPVETTVLAGASASFEAAAHATPAPTVQWEVSSNAGAYWSQVAGATSDVLTIPATTVAENGDEYRAAFTNVAGTSYSHPAPLYVAASDFTAFGWGLNSHGQAGVGSGESSIPSPLPIKGMSFVKALAAGQRHSLALLINGTVDSWGFNGHGQLGNEGSGATRTPEPVEHLKHVTAIAAGGNHSLALLTNGTVMAWGDDESGQLGDGKNTDSEVPVPVEGLNGVVAIAAGEEDSLALLSNGTVMAWGENSRGQLGTGGKDSHNRPVAVQGLSGVTAIAAGGQFSLALLSNGTVVAWGDDTHGQLGSRAFLEDTNEGPEEEGFYSGSPVPVEELSEVRAIAAGRTHALALMANGTVEAWGSDGEGELGNGTVEPQADTPAPVGGLSGVSAIAAGQQQSVALLATGSVEAWGANGFGSLGDGVTGAASDVPVAVHSITGAAGIAAGGGQVLAFGASLPSVSSISPQSGALTGGTAVRITGSDIGTATSVHFGATAATHLIVNSSTSVTATSPAGSGTVDVTVTTPSGTSPAGPADRFSYRPPPTVSKLSVKDGPAAGGTELEITGGELTGTTAVYFGTVAASEFKVVSAGVIAVTTPSGVGGKQPVTVVTPAGTSAATSKTVFKFTPAVTGVSPDIGQLTGGTSVTITGAGFAPGSASEFKFGKAKVSSVECASTTSCTAVVPAAKAPGTVDVTVSVGKSKSPSGEGDRYTYE